MKESKRESKTEARSGKARERARDEGQDGLVPSGEIVMASSNHSGPVVHTGAGANRLRKEMKEGARGMSRRQEHNMWSEESRGQQRGARGQQFKPEWTVMGVDRESEERMMSRAAPQR